ncbi:MAG TPA: hypothetical protein VN811_06005 [Thermoanaerobaculia bacterium]|nr:hypothetical protein [Thermoanaerobaculia bacterium]HXT50575.1 hypothetical protein [Thermoanaerobaculia bacterium]
MRYLLAFVAGFVSTLIFHQGLLWLLHRAGASPRPAYVMKPVPPLGVPVVISLAFWGGIWAAALLPLLARWNGSWIYWLAWLVAGAVLPSIVALFVVMPLKGMPVAGGGNPKLIVGALLLNGAWGLGTALLLRLLQRLVPGTG